MPKIKQVNSKSLFFSNRIKEALDGIQEHPLTIVEAPMGYGKTTAVKEFLNSAGLPVLWQRVYDSSTDSFWNGFSRLFREMDNELSQSLLQLGFPGDILTAQEALNMLEKVKFPQKTVLVIDDYHLADSTQVNAFIEFLAKTEIDRLHLVLTARYTKFEQLEELKLKGVLHHITKDALELDVADISRYYRACGILLEDREAQQLYSTTNGWISALYLFLLEYIEEGSYSPAKSIHKLMEKAVYKPLPEESKDFLLTLCMIDRFSLEQAAWMWEKGNSRKLLEELTGKNAFINYDPGLKVYHIHTLFTGYLREELEQRDTLFKKELLHRAARWYLEAGDHAAARGWFYECGDYDGILRSLDEDSSFIYSSSENELLKKYVSECPEKNRAAHPYAMLKYALCLFVHNEKELFGKACREMAANIAGDTGLQEEQRNRLLGELQLLLGFSAFNNLKAMAAHQQKAWDLMHSSTTIYEKQVHWNFGSPSILYLYYRESGKLEEHVRDLIKHLPLYNRLSNGHGSGGEYVMEAEWYFNRGDFDNAEISMQKALLKAQAAGESNIKLCVQFLNIRLAFVKGDFIEMLAHFHKMREDMASKKEYYYLHTVEICESTFYALLSQPSRISQKLLDMELRSLRLAFPAFAFFNIMRGRALLIQGEYLKLIGSEEFFCSIASIFTNQLSFIYTYIYLAAANMKTFREKEALACLGKALDIALPDRVYMPFAENCDYIEPLLERLKGERTFREGIDCILALYRIYRKARERILAEHFAEERPKLTEREGEIARLAASGITNLEIGKLLYISPNTVKVALKSIYSKLGIKNRALLQQNLEKLEQ